MKRINFNIREDQLDFLTKTPISIAEHFRRAVDDYIEKLKALNASSSQSKAGEKHG